ncbi:FxSxx-COOH system tetratricopeptide repeat protein [Streptomyces sp. NBC_01613]|uniref:FxSxx-COOH system tetratricopeptide repeat protein n=1 Tax=Streptomyces sp. NBC_01613 TaxID=2975896 RepID=UPI003867B4B2
MTGKWRRRRSEPASTPEPRVAAAQGSNAAGRDVINSVAFHAAQATLLPAEAYAPIPDDAGSGGLSNIPRTELFVGRRAQLDALDAAFATPGVVLQALSGLGGVGKTSLAARWAATRAASRVRWWITADSPVALDVGLTALARALQPGLTQLPVELQTERALQWLAGHGDWLLVLDNVDHPDHIRPFLDRMAGAGRVLVTTRRATGWHHLTTTIRLDVFTPDESVELFTRILVPQSTADIDAIVEVCDELGHLALSIEQAAAFCFEADTSPLSYLDMVRQSPAAICELGPEGGDSERTVAQTWQLTLNRLADTPLAGQILRILAWYAPDHIPRELLDGLADTPALTAAIGRLQAYSMISSNEDGTLSVHRLVQALARTPHPSDPHRQPHDIELARDQAIGTLDKAFPEHVEAQQHSLACRGLLPHIEAMLRNCPPERDTSHLTHLFHRTSRYHLVHGVLPRAITYGLRVLSFNQHRCGDDHPNTWASRDVLAAGYWSAGDLDKAIPLYEQNLADRSRLLGREFPDTLHSCIDLASAYNEAGDFARAISLSENVLAVRIRVLGEGHTDTVATRNDLANSCLSAGDMERAILLFQQNLAASKQFLGASHPVTLMCQNNVAYGYQAAGQLVHAIQLYQQSLAQWKKLRGRGNHYTLLAAKYLADAYQEAGDLDRAIRLHAHVLTNRIRVFGNDHPHTIIARADVAAAYEAADDPERATPLYEETLAVSEKILGEDHPFTAGLREYLSRRRGDLLEAE